jgi:putative ABC transport system permease protein
MFKYAVKNAFRRRSIAILSIIGIAIGVSLMTTMSAIGATITEQTNQFSLETMDSITISQQDQISYQSQINLSDLINITSLEHIEAFAPQVLTIIGGGGGFFDQNYLVGVDPSNDTALEGYTTKITEGVVYQNDNECIVSESFAATNNYDINDVISFLTPSYDYVNLTIVGLYDSGMGFASFGFSEIYSTPNTVRYFKIGFTEDTYSIIVIKVDDINNVETVRDQINTIIEDEGLLIQLTVASDQLETLTQFAGTMNILVISISLIAGIAGGMAIIVSMLMSVLERMKEFATLKATGWQNKHVIKDIIYESLIVTVIGGIIGYLLGFMFLTGISGFGALTITPLNLSTITLITVFVIALGIIGGLYPAYKASKASPVEILRGE